MNSLRDVVQGTGDDAMGKGDAPGGAESKILRCGGDETAPMGEEESPQANNQQQDRSQLMDKDDDGLDPLVQGLQNSLIADEEHGKFLR